MFRKSLQKCLHSGTFLQTAVIPYYCCLTSLSEKIISHQSRCSSSNSHSPDKTLFTTGPFNITWSVKTAMMRDVGARDIEFIDCVKYVRQQILDIAGASSEEFSVIPIQGTGTYALEAALQTFTPREKGKVLILENGGCGRSLGRICVTLGIPHEIHSWAEDVQVKPEDVEKILRTTRYDLVTLVHHETTAGVVNPVGEIGGVIKAVLPECVYLVDAMISLGSLPLSLSHVDIVVSSGNNSLQGAPGLGVVLARHSVLDKCEGNSRSLSLDLFDQAKHLDMSHQFRFTPPTHTMNALRQAIVELQEEGGVEGRAARYKNNNDIINSIMKDLGFEPMVAGNITGHILSTFMYPRDENFDSKDFYQRLSNKGFVLHPGRVSGRECIRICNIGDLHEGHMMRLGAAIGDVCKDMKVEVSTGN